MDDKQYIKAGKVIGAHGIRGGLKVFSYLEKPANFGIYKNFLIDSKPIELELNFTKDNIAVIDIEGIRKRELAEAMIGKEIFMPRSELPALKKGEFYYTDIIGLKVIENGKETGVITDIQNFGSGDTIEIKFNDERKTKLFAYNKSNFPQLDKESGTATFNSPEEEFVPEEN